jgi:hypothetical protein
MAAPPLKRRSKKFCDEFVIGDELFSFTVCVCALMLVHAGAPAVARVQLSVA